MENNGYHLDLFTNSMIQYFNEVLIHKNYVSISFRKHSLKNGEDSEFSFQIKTPTSKTDCDEQLLSRELDSAFFTEEDFEKLISQSQLWSLHLADVSIKGSRLIFKLNRPQALYRVLKSILNEQAKYGVNFTIIQITCLYNIHCCSATTKEYTVVSFSAKNKGVKISVNECPVNDLTQLRLRLLKRTAENILNAVHIRNEKEDVEVCLTTKPVNSKINVLCGVVVNAEKGTKETELTPEEYYNMLLNDMRTMSEHKYWQTDNEHIVHDLADGNLTMSLLEVNPNRTVPLKTDSVLKKSGGSSSKGASFVLYNCARLASIRKKFREKCNEGIYPKPPNFEDLDFSLLAEKEEWYILFNYLLEYPAIIRKLVQDLQVGIFNIHQICKFLYNLSSLFSVYYRRVRVLLEPRQHLLPLIFARLQLITAVEQVMHNALFLLNIKIIEEM